MLGLHQFELRPCLVRDEWGGEEAFSEHGVTPCEGVSAANSQQEQMDQWPFHDTAV